LKRSFDTPAERVKYARKLTGLTRPEIEVIGNLNQNTLKAWEYGRNALTEQSAHRLSDKLYQLGVICSPDWLLTGVGKGPTLAVEDAAYESRTNIQIEIDAFKVANPHPVIYQIPDDALYPYFEVGEYVAGSKMYGGDIKTLYGSFCIVETKNREVLARKLIPGKKEDTYTLSALNPKSDATHLTPDIYIRYAAKIVWRRLLINK